MTFIGRAALDTPIMTTTRLGYALVTLAALLGAATACEEDDDGPSGQTSTIVDVAAASGELSTLVSALQSTGLDATLRGDGPFTVFAPTDAAFALLPDGLLASLDGATLSSLLRAHVAEGELLASDVAATTQITTLGDGPVAVQVGDGTVVLDGRVQVVRADLKADNGVIHVIDAVLVPGPFPGSVFDVLAASPRFSTLARIIEQRGLPATLADASAPGLTLFAPTNQAFETVDLAGVPETEVTRILLYHLLPAAKDSAAVAGAASHVTVEGTALPVQGQRLNDQADITYADIETSNGFVHVLNGVLTPSP